MQEQPFYIGQKVVAIKDHSEGVYKKGDTFKVTHLFKPFCLCGVWNIGIGLKATRALTNCKRCNTLIKNNGVSMFTSKAFAPVHEGFESISFTKVLEEELVSVN